MNGEKYKGIAIIGMAGRFPGADSVEEFWSNLLAGKESISQFSDLELAQSGLDPAALRRRGHYVAARGILKDADCFDAAFFGISSREAEVMDPQHRLFLEACWIALESAGYVPDQMLAAVGVWGGATRNTYYLHALQPQPDLLELVGSKLVMYGNEVDYLTTRVAYKLGLKGPALNVSTACSTSLVAICQASQALLTYQCDLALAGGVSIVAPQKSGYYYDEGNIGSPDGHTRTFDAQAAGVVPGSGIGVVVLKRLEEAVNDGDEIFAVIKGAAINNDGAHRVSFTAPGVEGQSEVIAMAHALAGIDPATISYIEAHGTATPLGDPIEVAALTKAFRFNTQAKQFCAIGSVKSNIGHLDAAAGVAGLIKAALSLRNKVIPPSLNFTKPNPKLDLENSPFYVNSALQEWKAKPGNIRRAGVSSFGMGGTNAHVVMEEAPELPPSGTSRPWQLLTLSTKTADALDRSTANLSAHLKKVAHDSDASTRAQELADVAFTLQTGRSEFTHRRILACQDPAEAVAALDASDTKRVFTHHQQLRESPVVFMFPGQGAQYSGMGAHLYDSEGVFRAEIDRCAEWLRPMLQVDLRTILFPAAGSEKEADQLLSQTRFTQPALFVIEYALAKLWMSWGVKPAAMIGHSVGEYVAGCLAGVFSLKDALSLVARRGALVQAQPGGAMLSVRLPAHEITSLLNGNVQLEIAAINSPNLCVVAGPHDAIATLEKELNSREVATRRLHTSHAFHSSMMEPVLAPFTELLNQVKLNEPQIPYVSNVTANWITASEAQATEYWAGHVRQTVRFADGIAELMKDPRNILLEVGPGQTLSTLARQNPVKSIDQSVLASMPLTDEQELRGVLEALGRLWMTGVVVDWQAFYANERRRRVVLPTYPFERKRYWPRSVPAVAQIPAPSPAPVASDERANTAPAKESAEISPPRNAEAPSGVPPDVRPMVSRKDRLLRATRALFQELSGGDFSDVNSSVNFLELGLDSLLLTQAAQLFQRRFGVSFSFRQLMEELSSLEAIASYLDNLLAPGAFAAVPLASVTIPELTPAAGSGNSQTEVLEQLLRQQQQLTNQVLELMGRPPATVQVPAPSIPKSVSPLAAPADKPHGPFKPFQRSAGITLSAIQRKALDDLTDRYTGRTAKSKQLAAKNRHDLADPRSVSGFKQLWKEMVYPIYTTRSDGSKVWDVDGNEYVDFVMGFGANLFGHRPPFVVNAVREQLEHGFEIGPIQPLVGEVAELIQELTGMQRVAFTNTGSEAVLAATRIARTVTGRDKIVFFAGDYHGIFDEVLGRPQTLDGELHTAAIAPGIPGSALDQVIVLEYGDPKSLDILRARGTEIAAVLVEPVQSRRLDLQPMEFLRELRQLTRQTGSALIFDEVVTGFRIGPGGAQAHFGIRADLATYGKVIGGGLPIGVVAGDAKFMDALDGGQWQYGDTSFPETGVTFFAGTFVRHPLALAAAKAVLTHLRDSGPELQRKLSDRTAQLANNLRGVIDEFHAPYHVSHFGSFMHLSFSSEEKLAGLLFYLLRERGIHIWENRAFVLTTAHTDHDLTHLVRAVRESLTEMYAAEFLPPPSVPSGQSVPLLASSARMQSREEPTATVTARSDVGDAFPLTEAQKEIWLAAQMEGHAALAYNESGIHHFRGAFDVAVFREAARQVVERHPILLAQISADGLSQRMKSDATLDVPLVDLSNRSEAERERELFALVEREVSEPFILAGGPLFRVTIIRLSDQHHVVLRTVHHIVCDGWSNGLLASELATIYSALKQNATPVLEAPDSFREYALANQLDGPETRNAMEYWRQQFADLPPLLDLPTDRPRPPARSVRSASLERTLDEGTYKLLKRGAGQQRTTLVVLLMAALKTLIHRLTGQTDLVLGLGIAGQAVTGKNQLVGHCLNLLPIRTRLEANASFQDNLGVVKQSVLDAFDHHQCTIGSILQHLKVPRSLSRAPLVEVIFNVDRDPGVVEFHGVECTAERNPKRALHYDLFFNFVEGRRGLRVQCDYNTDLFDAATIDRWLTHYQTLLQDIATDPTITLGHLRILTEAESRELTVEWNRTGIEFPKQETLHESFERQVKETPNARALTFEGRHLTYGELNRRANQVAHYLKKLGVGPDRLVGLYLERSAEIVVGILGILKAGGAYLPIDPVYPRDRVAFMLADAQAPVLLTHSKLASELFEPQATVVCFDRDAALFEAESDTDPLQTARPDNLAYVIYTSGSTGKPKGSRVTHYNVMRLLQATQGWYHFNEEDVWTFFHSHAFDFSVWELWGALLYGGRLVMVPYLTSRSPDDFFVLLANERVTVLNQTPSAFRQLIEAEGRLGTSKNLALRYVIFGGEMLEMQSLHPWFDRHGDQMPLLVNMYGITETTVHVTYRPLSKADVNSASVIGVPIPDLQVYLLDQYQQPVPIGVIGEIYVGGAGVARGYLNQEELSRQRFLPDSFTGKPDALLYRTGDLARFLANRDIEYVGRADHQVKIRGFRIELGEVEAVLGRYHGIGQCVVVAREEETGDKRLVAYYETQSEAQPSASDLRACLMAELPDYMIPSAFVRMERLPLTPNGKLDRKALPAPTYADAQPVDDFVEPRTEIQKTLAAVWSEVLKVEKIGIHSNFFDLGGHSLLVMRVVSRIRDLFELDLSVRTFFANPTIAGLATAVAEARGGAKVIERIDRRKDSGPSPLSFAQERMWFLDQLTPASSVYNILDVVRFEGVLDTEALQRAVRELLHRHEILRTAFPLVDGQPMQVISPEIELVPSEVDLRDLEEQERQAAWIRLANEVGRKPFDLSQAPLLRLTLVHRGEQEHLLLLAIHHIITDEWSMELLGQELEQLYEAFSKGRPSPLPELPIQYADFACWQRDWLQGEVLDKQISYWKTELAGSSGLLELPTDKPRPPVQTFCGAVESFELPKELLERLKLLGRQELATTFMTLEAAFMVLLHRYTGQDDLLVGTPISERTHSETEGLIGLFLNTIVLRAQFTDDLNFRSLLRQVRDRALGAYVHQGVPFERVVAECATERDARRMPLVQAMFVLNRVSPEALALAADRQLENSTSKFDLTLFLAEVEGGLRGTIEYNTDLFEADSMRRMAGHFRTLLDGIAHDPDQSISTIPLLTEDERQQVLVNWNDTAVSYEEKDRCLHQPFESQAFRIPDHVAVVFEREQLTYDELNRRANRLAHHLRGLGVEPDVPVGLFLERSPEMIVALMGVLKAGGAYLPLDLEYPKERLRHILEDSGVSIVVTQQSLVDELPSFAGKLVRLDTDWAEIANNSDENPVTQVKPENLAYVLFTSGSTGRPKGVALEHRTAVNFLHWSNEVFTAEQLSGVLFCTSICFDLSVFEIFVTLSAGGKVILAPNALYLPTLPAKDEVTLLNTVPSAMAELVRISGVPASVQTVNLAGEALSDALVEQIYANTGVEKVYNLYGPTETSHSTYTLVRRGSAVTIGRPIANARCYILDAHRNPVPIGVPGELYITGDNMARGYYGRPDLTEERFVPNPFDAESDARMYRTGDLCRWLPQGNIQYIGRIDHQVKIRGFRIELGEVEAVLGRYHGIGQCVVVAREEETGDKRLVAYYETQSEAQPSASDLRACLMAELPDYMIPSAFVRMERLPLTPNGKLDRKALPAPTYADAQPVDDFVEPRTEIQKTLAAVWSEVLKVEKIGIHSNFFDLGGHSLLVMRVVSRIRDLFELDLSVRTFFANPTIAGLATAVAEARGGAKVIERIDRRKDSGPSPLSFAQERMWFLDQLTPASSVYNILDVVRFEGVLDTEALQRAVRELLHRHEILRTAFPLVDGQPMQVISPEIELVPSEVDLRDLEEQERQAAWIRLANEVGRKPFDLSQAPLLRLTLVHRGEQEHLLLLAIHHIITDEWSMELLGQELEQLYEAFSKGRPSPLPELPIQYADFACWQRDWLQGEVLDKQISYWKTELAGSSGLLELPTDKPRPPVQTFCGAVESFELPKELLERLKLLGRQELATTFMTLEAAFMVLLHRYTGQDDLLVGTPISERTHSETEGLIGLFLNTIVLRAQFTDDLNFRSLLRQVRDRALGAYVHQGVPFERVVAECATERDARRMPLVQAMFVLNRSEAVSGKSKVTTGSQHETTTSKFELSLYLAEVEGGLRGTIEYNTDLFEADSMRRMAGHFRTLLDGIAHDPDQSISTIPLLTEDERQQVLVNWNDTAVSYEEKDRCLHQLFESQAERTPNRVALVFDQQQLTYTELNRRANQLAHHLRQHGVGPDVLVAVFLERSAEMVVALLGILKAGGAYVPIDPEYPAERISFMLHDAGTNVVLTQGRLRSRIAARSTVLSLDDDWEQIAREDTSNPVNATHPENLAYMIYTSGSTGVPKGAMNNHCGIVNRLLWMQEQYRLTEQDTILQKTPFSFDVSVWEFFWPLLAGARLVMAMPGRHKDPYYLVGLITSEEITVLHFVPSMLRMFLADPGVAQCRSLRHVICSGEALPYDLQTECFKFLPAQLHNLYGPTEAAVDVTHWTCQRNDGRQIVPIGRPVANTKIYILDTGLQPAPIGVGGELYIGGVQVGRGYHNRPELTKERFIADPFSKKPGARLYKTGDLCRWLADGAVEYLGRMDFQIKIRGFRIELGEVETVLGRHEGVRQCVVVAREEIAGDKRLVAYFKAQAGAVPTVADLRAHLMAELPDYMVPSAFVRMETLPLSSNGKLDRKALPAPDQQSLEVKQEFVAPRDSIEQMLVQLWSRILRTRNIGLHDNFFELGGHSILAVRIVAEIDKLYKMRLPLATLLQAPTIAELAEVLRKNNWTPPWSSLVPIRPGGSKPILFLMHSHGGNVLEYYPLAAHLDPDQPVYALQARGLDGRIVANRSLKDMVADYVRELRGLQPEGPYFLGGFCFGGILALEAARQLAAEGEKVPLVVLIQTIHPDSFHFKPGTVAFQRLWYRAKKRIEIERDNLSIRGRSFVFERCRRAGDVTLARMAIALNDLIGNGHAPRPTSSLSYILESLAIEHSKAVEGYEPRPYSGDVLLLRANKQMPGIIAEADPYLGWRGVLQGALYVCAVPGHQQTIMVEPHVAVLAKHLEAQLLAARERRGVGTKQNWTQSPIEVAIGQA